jgi:hypothetical protein
MTVVTPHRMAALIGPMEEARRFFFALYRGGLMAGEWWELRCLDTRRTPAGIGPRLYFRSLTEMAERAVQLRNDWDVFYGVGLRRCGATHAMARCPHQKRGIDHISRLPGAWVDLDVKSHDEPTKRYDSIADGLEALYALPEPPDIIVGSGAGLHAYWPFDVLTSDLERVVGINTGIVRALGVDNCGDAPRILRVPGTFNHKHGRALPVRLIEAPERGPA